jgi:hypothetical protein
LVVGIIILFVGVSVLSSVSSKDVSFNNDRIEDDNKETKLLNGYIHLFSKVYGSGYSREPVSSGLDLFVTFLYGTFSVRSFCLKPFGWQYYSWGSLSMGIFIGTSQDVGSSYYLIDGIALGYVYEY